MKMVNWTSLGLTAAVLVANLTLIIFDIWPDWMYDGMVWGIDKEFSRTLGIIISVIFIAIMLIMAIWMWWGKYRGHCRRYVISMWRR